MSKLLSRDGMLPFRNNLMLRVLLFFLHFLLGHLPELIQIVAQDLVSINIAIHDFHADREVSISEDDRYDQ